MERVQVGGRHVDLPEGVLRLLDFVPVPDVAILDAAGPLQVEHVIDVLERHGEALDPVCQFDGDRREIHTAGLLEVSELGDLLAVEQNLPANAPGAKRRRFPVVLFEADVVRAQVDPAGLETLEVQLLDFIRCGLENDLKLMVLEQTVRIFAESSVGRTARRLHVRDAPVSRPKHPQERFRMHRSGAHLDVERLLKQAST